MDKLRKLCHNSYPFINNLLPILEGYPVKKMFHNKHRLKCHDLSRDTFDGNTHCGGASYLLSYYLDKNGTYNTLTTVEKGHFKSKRTHSYLIHNYHIIDPTYRQMFLPDSSEIENIKGDDEYYTNLFENEPQVFIGTFDELVSKSFELQKLHEKVYNGRQLESQLDMWRDGIDASLKCDFHKVVEDLSYAAGKGPQYMKLHMHLQTNLHKY